ncbi:LIM domain kinase 1 isoform X2 [Nymphalis io]|uniref:LIM domain kinase 1 isoform X2 n=1 Tax=Inachis io TaxID=171585 RepID=UPI00216820CC|nr:LIM domain kinase 1 isoform X2 [Nymphalis io]
MEGSNTREIISCACCLNDIGDEDYVSALGQEWHRDCFRCSECDAQLTTWYFEKSGMLFCQADYWTRYGDNCQQCSQVITGPVMAAGEHRFHPECFACASCGAHLEDTEPYALLDRSELYCGACYAEWLRRGRHDAHAIRVLRAPAHALRLSPDTCGAFFVSHSRCADKVRAAARALLRAALRVCLHLACRSIDSSCNMLTLHIGDKVLEVNGTPVRNRPLSEIERVLARPEIIQLTIEHNPDTINAKRGTIDVQRQSDEHKLTQEKKTPVEKHIFKEDIKKNIPNIHSNDEKSKEEIRVRRERLFKRKGEDGGKVRVIKKRQIPSSPLLGDKERSSSMSKLLDVVEGDEVDGVLGDLSRARSFRTQAAPGQVFRASDLLQGELLGMGFFGQVYKVTHRATGEVMVLKQLYRVDEEAQRNFLKEVAVLRSLRHRNVLRFVGVLYRDRRLHLVTEYVAGGTLHALLQDGARALGWGTRGRLARDVAAGVGYLHRRNVIHRDLNSHNCLIRPGEELTVVVADFGLARIVQRTASSALPNASLRRKRYTVVGNPYWMAPEMMNGNVYDEKVDVFSFGIILCEIIGRVSADPDFLPRRGDFGLNERAFQDAFCAACPEPFYRLAFLACHLDPDARPPFEVIEIWLESLVMHLQRPGPLPPTLLADILQYAHGAAEHGRATPECCQHYGSGIFYVSDRPCEHCVGLRRTTSKASGDWSQGVIKSASNAALKAGAGGAGGAGAEAGAAGARGGQALGKCVSASHLPPARAPAPRLSRSAHALAPGYILRAHGDSINITKVDDISEWLEPPPPLKRSSPDAHLNDLLGDNKTRKLHEDGHLPCFLRNQSVEGLETTSKHEVDSAFPFCRHQSIPGHCEDRDDTDSSEDDFFVDSTESKINLADIVKKGGNLLSKKASYDVTDVTLRHEGERNVDRDDCRRFNIDYLTNLPLMMKAVENIPKNSDAPKPVEKTTFFAKKILSPKLSRLFKPNTAEVVRKQDCDESKDERSRSKFFIQRPTSPSIARTNHRVRPAEEEKKSNLSQDVLKSDLKLASLGKPMTPIFRRHLQSERPDFTGRFSYRDRRYEPKTPDKYETGRSRLKANPVEKKLTQLNRNSQNNVPLLAPVIEKDKLSIEKDKLGIEKDKDKIAPKRREIGISRSNYVKLANLRISKELGQVVKE